MLRKGLLIFALGLLAVGLGSALAGFRPAVPMLVWGAVLSAAVLFERWRYRPRGQAGTSEWQETDERFIDPESGERMRVLYNPRTGERRYQPARTDDRPAAR